MVLPVVLFCLLLVDAPTIVVVIRLRVGCSSQFRCSPFRPIVPLVSSAVLVVATILFLLTLKFHHRHMNMPACTRNKA
jgi:hypothetical protein